MKITTVKDHERPRQWGRDTPPIFVVTRGVAGNLLARFMIAADNGAEAARVGDEYQYILRMVATGRRGELTDYEVGQIPWIVKTMVVTDR